MGLQFSTNPALGKSLSRLLKQGKLRKIYHGIYTTDLTSDIYQIVQKNWMEIVTYIVRDGIVSFRTAHDLKPSPYKLNQTIVFITSSYEKNITLPGLNIKVLKGNKELYIEQILPGLARSNEARMLLENLSSTRGSLKNIKTINQEGVEKYLAKQLRHRYEIGLNEIRDKAKDVASKLDMIAEFNKLNQIICGLLATHPDPNFLQTTHAKSIARKQPYDAERIKMFEDLSIYLQQSSFKNRPYKYDATSFKNIAFFDSYFSNYIEGTEFEINEAEQIVFEHREIYQRHADSHDILANFRLGSDELEMSKTPGSPAELLEIIQARHAYLMHERPDINPGKFKEKPNRAGGTNFVEPNEVIGTLTQGFEIYALLPAGIKRALFMHILISEVHPFIDGNGRLSRIMMNAELVQAQSYKIIIPTVYRDAYIQSLRRASREQIVQTYCKVMDVAQAYTASIPWDYYSEAREKIEFDKADNEPDDGITTFNRVVRKLELSDFMLR